MPMTGRFVSAVVLLVIGAGLGLLAVPVHYEFMSWPVLRRIVKMLSG